MKTSLISALGLAALATAGSIRSPNRCNSACKCYPGDSCWPSEDEWNSLREATENRLVTARPIGLPCYATYEGRAIHGVADEGACAEVQEQWTNATWVANQPSWPMQPFWSNTTCYPSNSPSLRNSSLGASDSCPATCEQGFVPKLVILAEKVADIEAGVRFATRHNLRILVRNTGHDFMGRSVGWGSLTINTHRLNEMTPIDNWSGPGEYRGRAIKIGAGVMIQDLYAKVWSLDQDVLAGECPTVGVAGGFIQGGGQGPLSGLYGAGSDTALEFEVVLADGHLVKANEDENPDLFWALKGGGPGAFGVVVSVVMKTFDRVPVAGMALNITGEGDAFWNGFRIWHSSAPELVKHGIYVWYSMQEGFLRAQPFVAPNLTAIQLEEITRPMFDRLDAAGVEYARSDFYDFASFEDLYNTMWYRAFHNAGGDSIIGGRLISITDMEDHGADITGSFREMTRRFPGKVVFGGHLVNPGNAVPDPEGKLSSIHPVWRNSADIGLYLYFTGGCSSAEERQKLQNDVTYDMGDLIRAVTPTSGVYVNEADVNEPEWQKEFWGPQYPRLFEIKEKYDPTGVFWTKATPGSEKWKLVKETKLCRA